MDQVASKCYLGIAIDEVIKELGLEKKSKKIFEAYFESFMQHYPTFKNSFSDQSKVEGKLEEHFEYPIGEREALQYYLAYGEMSFSLNFLRHMKNDHATMLEGFSTNEGAKGKSNKRARKGNLKTESEFGRKKKN